MSHRILDIRGLADLDDGRIDLPVSTKEEKIVRETCLEQEEIGGQESKKKKKRKTRNQRGSEQERTWSRARFGAEDFGEVPSPKD